MTDADVDGAHIAALLMTYFFRAMPKLIEAGHLYLALPPLFKIAVGAEVHYARDEADRDRLIQKHFKNRKVEISRFKGLGEMSAKQLKETTMDPKTRRLDRVSIDAESPSSPARLVEELMGRKPETRLAFIQNNALMVKDLDV
jgi:topoisomerase-4 subunit B